MVFPGMDPYVEDPQVWPDVHASFIRVWTPGLIPRGCGYTTLFYWPCLFCSFL